MKILFIKTSSLGDIVQSMPTIHDILTAYPQAKIDWLVEEYYIDLVRQVRGIRAVIPVAIRRWRQQLHHLTTWREMRTFIQYLRQQEYDWIIDAQGLLKSAILAGLARGISTGWAARPAPQAVYEFGVKFFYTQRIYIQNMDNVFSSLRWLAAKSLGYSVTSRLNFGLDVFNINAVHCAKPYVIFFHGSAKRNKLLADAFWESLGKNLAQLGLHILLPWGNLQERVISQELAFRIGSQAMTPEYLDFAHITQWLFEARAVVGVDTGLSHLAAALGRPTVQIYRLNRLWCTHPDLKHVTTLDSHEHAEYDSQATMIALQQLHAV